MCVSNFWEKLNKPIKVLAPMEDVTDTVFRQLIAKWAPADVYFTEFTNAEGLGSAGKSKVMYRWKYTEKERPLVAQIWGLDPQMHYKSAKMAEDLGFDGVDINMGCPVKKIVKKGACSALIENPGLAKEIIQATKEGAGKLPVSVKTRIGFRTIQTEEWATFLLQQNLQALTIHGRTSKQDEKPADWSEVAKVVKLKNKISPNTIIIGNGDVRERSEIEDKHKTYGVDGVMVARGILENILIFKEGQNIADLEINKKLEMLTEHINLFTKTWGEGKNFYHLKKYFKIYLKGFENAGSIRGELMKTQNAKEAKDFLKSLRV